MSTISHLAESDAHELHAHVAGEPKKKRTGSIVGLVGRIVLCLVFGLPLLFMIVSIGHVGERHAEEFELRRSRNTASSRSGRERCARP